GHGSAFKKKMRECGITTIYHDMGRAAPLNESAKRYILRCETCAMELLRKRMPSRPMSCARCDRRRFNPKFPLTIYEIVETREVGSTLEMRAARGVSK
ncbi:MAG: hypothetical protein JOZ38_09595, partial [Candidatus Eremiobacteraeota bacterium]|nr:hypothetical protein [Candidatus Eremiobacteraeota bacterium]